MRKSVNGTVQKDQLACFQPRGAWGNCSNSSSGEPTMDSPFHNMYQIMLVQCLEGNYHCLGILSQDKNSGQKPVALLQRQQLSTASPAVCTAVA